MGCIFGQCLKKDKYKAYKANNSNNSNINSKDTKYNISKSESNESISLMDPHVLIKHKKIQKIFYDEYVNQQQIFVRYKTH